MQNHFNKGKGKASGSKSQTPGSDSGSQNTTNEPIPPNPHVFFNIDND